MQEINQQPFQTPHPVQNNHFSSKNFLPLVLFSTVLIILTSTATYLVLKSRQSPLTTVQPTLIPTQTLLSPSPNPGETANWKNVSLNKLLFKIPSNWWSRSHAGPNDQWVMVNPTSLEGNPEPIAAFEAHFYSTSLKQKKQQLIDAYPIDVKTEKSISVAGVSGEKITGSVSKGPIQGKRMQLVFLPIKNGVYDFINFDSDPTSSDLFDQILSTFRFLE